jgi:hypothetical protein
MPLPLELIFTGNMYILWKNKMQHFQVNRYFINHGVMYKQKWHNRCYLIICSCVEKLWLFLAILCERWLVLYDPLVIYMVDHDSFTQLIHQQSKVYQIPLSDLKLYNYRIFTWYLWVIYYPWQILCVILLLFRKTYGS